MRTGWQQRQVNKVPLLLAGKMSVLAGWQAVAQLLGRRIRLVECSGSVLCVAFREVCCLHAIHLLTKTSRGSQMHPMAHNSICAVTHHAPVHRGLDDIRGQHH